MNISPIRKTNQHPLYRFVDVSKGVAHYILRRPNHETIKMVCGRTWPIEPKHITSRERYNKVHERLASVDLEPTMCSLCVKREQERLAHVKAE